VNHGEADTARGFADAVAQRFGWNVTAAAPGLAVDV
jgi:hypothetical protein